MPAQSHAESPATSARPGRVVTGRVRAGRAVAAPRCAYCGGRLGSRAVWREGRPFCDAYCACAVPGLYLG